MGTLLSDLAPFNLYIDKLPPTASSIFVDYAYQMHHDLYLAPTIEEAVVLPPNSWVQEAEFVHLCAFGRFRSPVRVITGLSRRLAQAYLSSGVLPIVRPVLKSEWKQIVQEEGRLYQRIRRHGFLIYSRGRIE